MSPVWLRRDPEAATAVQLSALTRGPGTAVIGPEHMRRLLAPAPGEEQHLLTAWEGDLLLGHAHLTTSRPAVEVEGAPREPEPAAGLDGMAWLVSAAVDPDHRGRGIGRQLLAAALGTARDAGARRLEIAARPRSYVVPGIDLAADPRTGRLLARAGFSRGADALAMHRTLHDLPALGGSTRGRADVTGHDAARIDRCTAADLDELITTTRRDLAPAWGEVLRAHADRGGPLHRILLARAGSGPIVGFAGHGLVGVDPAFPDPTRFGPFGVAASARGAGIGARLLDATLQAMAGEGLAHVWFQWTGRGTPAERLYRSRGFTELRTFARYTTDLEDERPPPASEPGDPTCRAGPPPDGAARPGRQEEGPPR
ncbi:GNAT family N-acetyltransferase [Brachybacterium hainanense]|uniref:GNAT family N-acetyltransferase n=1 Tax=Brachybacterium hainanense TaxID=1541174 RepID=A0ABV6RB61_9MICO